MVDTAAELRRSLAAPRVLMYHFFGPPPPGGDPDRQFVSERALCGQLDLLARGGWNPIGLDEYLAWWDGARLPRRSFLLTIDDAHDSVAPIAAPLLRRAGVPFVLFVPSGLVGGPASWLTEYPGERVATAEVLRSLAGADVELGVHGFDHTRMVDMDRETLHLHASVARERLEELTGQRARAFAYPYGTHDPAGRQAVADAGYEVAFAVAREGGRFARWRICVDGNDRLPVFRWKLTPAYASISLAAGRMPGLRHRVRAVVGAVTGRPAD
ncbi:MAG TPA: polysaccharide deacetylase family protein [Pseudonocardia sp.]|nr:polysaccharide deacetylase family protein [Pseudonocardia sp.]